MLTDNPISGAELIDTVRTLMSMDDSHKEEVLAEVDPFGSLRQLFRRIVTLQDTDPMGEEEDVTEYYSRLLQRDRLMRNGGEG